MQTTSEQDETEEGMKLRAYSIGLSLKKSGLDEDVIYARLEKKGISEEMARQVAADITFERKKDKAEEDSIGYNTAIFKIGIGIMVALVSAILIPGNIVIPTGFILSGVLYAFLYRKK